MTAVSSVDKVSRVQKLGRLCLVRVFQSFTRETYRNVKHEWVQNTEIFQGNTTNVT